MAKRADLTTVDAALRAATGAPPSAFLREVPPGDSTVRLGVLRRERENANQAGYVVQVDYEDVRLRPVDINGRWWLAAYCCRTNMIYCREASAMESRVMTDWTSAARAGSCGRGMNPVLDVRQAWRLDKFEMCRRLKITVSQLTACEVEGAWPHTHYAQNVLRIMAREKRVDVGDPPPVEASLFG